MAGWFEIENSDHVLSPALLFYPERIKSNIQKMIRIAGSPDRLRPHIKTYKCREIVAMQLEMGINKFKCSTLSEALMLGECGAPDVLLAYPLVGPNQKRFVNLMSRFPNTVFSTLIDSIDQATQWESRLDSALNVYIDLDVGMHRTGVNNGEIDALLEAVRNGPFNVLGFHAYDGHIRDKERMTRAKSVADSLRDFEPYLNSPQEAKFIAGGSITFPVHAGFADRQLSPGTTLLWDRGYGESFPDLDFDIAAVLLTRVIGKPGPDLVCIDLGYKAVASEMKGAAPVYFPQLGEQEIVGHSEEHLVLRVKDMGNWKSGDVLYGFPWHICPTVALHARAVVVEDRRVTTFWEIASRNRNYSLTES